jgi:hypothetical protein
MVAHVVSMVVASTVRNLVVNTTVNLSAANIPVGNSLTANTVVATVNIATEPNGSDALFCQQTLRHACAGESFSKGGRCARRRMECVMKLNSEQLEQTLTQFEAHVIPDDHPLAAELNELFGDHTFLLDSNGLNVVEQNENAEAGTVVNLASWGDAQWTSLLPHEPEPTKVVVKLEGRH